MEESSKKTKQQQQHDANNEEEEAREPLVGGESGGVGPAAAFDFAAVAASAKASSAGGATTTTATASQKSVGIKEIQFKEEGSGEAKQQTQQASTAATNKQPHSSIWSSASSALWDDDSDTTEESICKSSKNIASDVSLLSGLLGRDGQSTVLDDVVGTFMRRGACVGLTIWLTLLFVTYMVAPADSYKYLKPREQAANALLLTLLIGVNINRLGPLFITERNLAFMKSGAMFASFTVQFIAINSNILMIFFQTPIIIDPTTGLRFHLVRWCEWTALAFIMCSLTEGIDLPLERSEGSTAMSWIFAWCVCLSTFCGYLFPFCSNTTIWMVDMIVSWVLFLALPIRFIQKRRRKMSLEETLSRDRTSIEKEQYERAKFSHRLLILCNIVWTILATTFTINCYMFVYGSPGSIWTDDDFVLMSENMCEALSKVGYLHILTQIHEQLFDDVAKTVRILQELCNYMSAVWDVSSDVVIICSKTDEIVNAAVSPAFFQLGKGYSTGKANQPGDPQITLIMEVDPYEGTYNTCEVDLSKPMTRQQANSLLKSCRGGNNDNNGGFTKDSEKRRSVLFQKNLKVLSDLVGDACAYAIPGGTNKQVLAKDFYLMEHGTMKHGLSCEAQIVNLKGKAVLIVLRDITGRLKLHKAESRLRKIDPDKQHYE